MEISGSLANYLQEMEFEKYRIMQDYLLQSGFNKYMDSLSFEEGELTNSRGIKKLLGFKYESLLLCYRSNIYLCNIMMPLSSVLWVTMAVYIIYLWMVVILIHESSAIPTD